jgi:protein ImuB
MAKEPELAFEECMDLEFAVELLDQLLFVLNRLLEQLCVRLRMHVLATSEIRVTLKLEKNGRDENDDRKGVRKEDAAVHERVLRLPMPAKESKFLLKLLKLDLEAHPPGAAVTAVKMVAVPTRSRTRQMGLYLPLSPEPEKLEVTLARIRATVGEGRVGTPVLLDTHRPNAFRQEDFVLAEMSERKVAAAATSQQAATAVALRIYRPALPATVELQKGKPARMVCDGVQRRVISYAGPWRTKGDWWAETEWARDEWDVLMPALRPKLEKESGKGADGETAMYRIYRDLRSRRWFVEGIYD